MLIPDQPRDGRQIRVFGLTGGTGSGKTEVANVFREHGVPVIDADRIGHEVIAPGGPGVEPVVQAFGDGVLTDGAIDRKKLGRIVFGDPAARERLNALVHPLIQMEVASRCAAFEAEGHPFVVIDAALLAEDGRKSAFLDGLIVVHADAELRARRLMAQRGWSREEVSRRMYSQTSPDEKLEIADFVLYNEGTLAELREKARRLIEELRNVVAQNP
jgi:dephospho-CoA kinase